MTRKTKAVLIGAAGLAAFGITARQHVQDRAELQRETPYEIPYMPVSKQTYPVYKLSIVPGGVHRWIDFEMAQAKDTVVKQHYAGNIWISELTLDHPAYKYVSYRRGNKAFWTDTKRRIPAGEKIVDLLEGQLRERCGNLLSDTPQQPTETKQPSDEEMNTVESQLPAELPTVPPETPDNPVPANIPEGLPIVPTEDVKPDLRLLNASVLPGSPAGLIAPIVPAAYLPGAMPRTAGYSSPFVPVAAAVVATPEPKTWGSLLVGFFVIAMLAIVRRKPE